MNLSSIPLGDKAKSGISVTGDSCLWAMPVLSIECYTKQL